MVLCMRPLAPVCNPSLADCGSCPAFDEPKIWLQDYRHPLAQRCPLASVMLRSRIFGYGFAARLPRGLNNKRLSSTLTSSTINMSYHPSDGHYGQGTGQGAEGAGHAGAAGGPIATIQDPNHPHSHALGLSTAALELMGHASNTDPSQHDSDPNIHDALNRMHEHLQALEPHLAQMPELAQGIQLIQQALGQHAMGPPTGVGAAGGQHGAGAPHGGEEGEEDEEDGYGEGGEGQGEGDVEEQYQ
ncbi:hypothetical protein EDD36DRAFT_119715 [Exophiala viscosa]|uniref:Uncharacterized protein n=1 Tax=Exophiala viscosa TaxID=2486360 RepID=A0AAN6IGA6_9EURO|nr:hypothetical protein EDD36DRAFT_119715 [Exophiala viscosa]